MTNSSLVDLVGVGLNATDTLIPLASYPERGSKMEYRSETILPGGQVASTVVGCQHWGLQTRYVGKLGDDAAAALNCKGTGARGGIETVEEIERLIATNFRHRSTLNVKNPTSNVKNPAKNGKSAKNVTASTVYVTANE